MHFDSAGHPKSPSLRKSKLFDASGNAIVFSASKKILTRKTNTNEVSDKRKSSELSTPIPCSGPDCDSNEVGSEAGSKSIVRRPTFKEFEGKFKLSRGSRLVKSQSLDHEPKSFSLTGRPPTPGSNLGSVKEKPGSGMKGLSRRAREVFLSHNGTKSDQKCITETEVNQSSKPASLMSRIFQR